VSDAATVSGSALDRETLQALLDGRHGEPLQFEKCSFKDEDFASLDLTGSVFIDCQFDGASFKKSILAQTTWRKCRGAMASFDMADLTEALFDGGDYNNTSWVRARLASTTFNEVKLTGAKFGQAQTLGLTLRHSILVNADLRGISFRKQRLESLNMSGADLAGCDFSAAHFMGGSLRDANLRGASFRGADLRGIELGQVVVGDLQQHFAGCTLSAEQAATIIGGLGITVI
jgi:fluoroquinolone resistance protein